MVNGFHAADNGRGHLLGFSVGLHRKRLFGRTLSINPGSSYEQGDLLGAVVDLDGKKKVKRFLLTSG